MDWDVGRLTVTLVLLSDTGVTVGDLTMSEKRGRG